MRLLLLITFIYFPSLLLGQDSLRLDSSVKIETFSNKDTVISDSNSSKQQLNKVTTKKKKPKKNAPNNTIKVAPTYVKEEIKYPNSSETITGPLIITILLVVILLLPRLVRIFYDNSERENTSRSKTDEFIDDYLKRTFLSHRDYYRNVYLKSEAWKRKRYLVLRRDNWRCVYCGDRATQVHHTRYAKRNIGKEPIEWLVSICRKCHDQKH